MMLKLRKHGTLLTMATLGTVGSCLVSALVLILSLTISPTVPSAGPVGAGVGTPAEEPIVLMLWLFLFLSVGWWLFAWMGGSLWRMNEDLMWRLMVCTGAFGLVAAAVIHDLLVIHLVHRMYLGDRKLPTRILTLP